MPKRGENIHKRKDGRWEGRIRVPGCGNTKYKSIYGYTYREVKDKMRLFSNNNVDLLENDSSTMFAEVLTKWLDNNRIRVKASTASKYENVIISHLLPELGSLRVSDISASTVNMFLQKKMLCGRLDGNGGLSSSYVKTMMLIINAALEYATNEGMCKPMKSPILKPPFSKIELRILGKEEQEKLEQYILVDLNVTKIGVLISLYTGLRIGEICALKWDDIDMNGQIIHVRHTVARVKSDRSSGNRTALILDSPKTKASMRTIPIPRTLMGSLMEWSKISKSDYVVSDHEGFANPRTFDKRFHKLLSEIGIPSINYHALRHTFATRCIEAGVDVKSLSEILGHANVSITLNTYVHSSMELKRQQLEKLVNY